MKFSKISILIAAFNLLALSACFASDHVDPEERIKELGIKLYTATPPTANYIKAVRSGNTLYLAGHIPQREDGTIITGKVGKDLTVEQGNAAARVVAINLISTLKNELGDLNHVVKIIKIFGMVNAVDTFVDHPKVINGASDLLVSVFGENRGKHTRSAVGMSSLPFGMAAEVEMVVEVDDTKTR